MFLLLPVMGISNGMQPIIGYNFGAENYARLKKMLYTALFLSTIASFTAYLLSHNLAKYIVCLFVNGSDIDLKLKTIEYMKLYLICIWTSGFQIIFCDFFVSIGAKKLLYCYLFFEI